MGFWNDYRDAVFHGDHSQHAHVGDRVVPISSGGGGGGAISTERDLGVSTERAPDSLGQDIAPPPPGYSSALGQSGEVVGPDPNRPGYMQVLRWDPYAQQWESVYSYKAPAGGGDGGPTGPFGESNLETLLAQPGVVGHEFIGNQLIIHLANGRADIYRDPDGDGGFTYGSNIASKPGPGYVPLGGGKDQLTTAPGLASMTDRLFSSSSQGGQLEGFLDYFAGTPETPQTEGAALTDVLRRSNPMQVGNPSIGTTDPFGVQRQGTQEDAARTYLEGQTPFGAPSRDQSVLGAFGLGRVNAYNDPLQAAALAQQVSGLQRQFMQDLGLDPMAAFNAVRGILGAA